MQVQSKVFNMALGHSTLCIHCFADSSFYFLATLNYENVPGLPVISALIIFFP